MYIMHYVKSEIRYVHIMATSRYAHALCGYYVVHNSHIMYYVAVIGCYSAIMYTLP